LRGTRGRQGGDAIGELAHPLGADWNLEIGGVSELDYKKRGPALLFDEIKGHKKDFRLLTSSTNSARRLGLIATGQCQGADDQIALERFGRAAQVHLLRQAVNPRLPRSPAGCVRHRPRRGRRACG
jgi:3-polyprenyl-4-hydroxybenzoate decarboxylase